MSDGHGEPDFCPKCQEKHERRGTPAVRWWTVNRTVEEQYCVSAPDAETAKRHVAHFEIPSKVIVLNATATPYEETNNRKQNYEQNDLQ